MDKLTVNEQVEKIIDEGDGLRRQVIVRMAGTGKNREAVLRTAAYEVLQKGLTNSARDLLPSPPGKSRVSRPSVTTGPSRRKLGVRSKLPVVSEKQLIRQAEDALKPLAAKELVASFPSSKSALLELTKDELARLPDDVPGIGDIYVNRSLHVPRVVEAKSLPANVADNKISSWGVTAIGALSVWGALGVRGQGVTVGILDTGVDATHPDLAGKVSAWAEFDADGLEVPNSQPHDTDQHGTHTAGTIVGGDASGQWIGVAPEAKLAAALVLDGEVGGTDAQVLAGIDWAVRQGVDVISMSLGGLTLGPEVPSTYTEAILTALQVGIPVITAIGNEGSQTSGSPGNDLFAFGVGATDSGDGAAGFSGGRTQIILASNFIPPEFLPLAYSKPDVVAPGVAIVSSIPGGAYAPFNGTSMATPHTAGAVALLLSATSIRDRTQGAERAFAIQDLLVGSVEELGESGQDHRYGFGRIDVLRAVGLARESGF